ncbi:MAG: OmpH family outer membrane protein [Parachlamydiales bacterium]|jgi:outer membrane protein
MKLLGKNIRIVLATLVLALPLSSSINAAEAPAPKIGVVNFKSCVEKSKLGKREQASFENLKKQMDVVLEKKEKEINEIAAKFNDPDYLDSLSQEAEAELKHKFRAASQELSGQQQQYYQALSQANTKIVQMITEIVAKAAEQVAKKQNLTFILNEEAVYFYAPSTDVTNLVVGELDRMFEEQLKNGSSEGRKAGG